MNIINTDQAKKAVFSFVGFKIKNFTFAEPENDEINLSIKFEPTGSYNLNDGVFILVLDFKATYGNSDESTLISISLKSVFKFEDKPSLEEIPSYFYRNSIAIVFPYVRAFVTTLTSVSNVKPLILPILNLGGLEQILKDNTSLMTHDVPVT